MDDPDLLPDRSGDLPAEAPDDMLAEGFESHRGRLRAVAYRMLGSMSEAAPSRRLGCAPAGPARATFATSAAG